MNRLPKELAIAFAEAHDDTVIAFCGRITRSFVIGADENLAAGNNWTPVGDLAKPCHPLDVLSLSLFGAPFRGHILVPGVDGIAAPRASTHGAIVVWLFPRI